MVDLKYVVILIIIVSIATPVSASSIRTGVERICDACGQKITGSYFETGSNFYHPRCFTCEHCGDPIKGPHTVYQHKSYHNECFEDHVALRCAVCQGIIQGEYLLDYWGNAYHTSHKDVVLQCDFCQRFIIGSLIDGMKRYGDGYRLCGRCSPSAVTSVKSANKLMTEVASYLENFGLKVDPGSIRLHLVDLRKLKELSPEGTHDTKGFTDYFVKKNVFGRVKDQTIDVYLLAGMPRTQMISTLAHELTHVWQFEGGQLEQDKALSEGSCNFAAYLVLRKIGGAEAEYVIETMLRDDDPIYGEGFRRVKAYAEKNGLASWLKLLKKRNARLSRL
ncbi:MAG: hypothetical protein JSW58_07420 [Candidatus Latescibacterota bacterium]|nr:MAG: hypothetical protein JSW58_07420 [Candidatus Latescibacterota bacterium]